VRRSHQAFLAVFAVAVCALDNCRVATAQPPPQAQPAKPVPIGNLRSTKRLSHRGDRIPLARQLHINYILDPAVKGGVIFNTLGTRPTWTRAACSI